MTNQVGAGASPCRVFAVDSSLYPDLDVERSYFPGVDFRVLNLSIESDASRALEGADGVVLGTTPLTTERLEMMTASRSVRVIGRPGVGLDNINLVDAKESGIGVIHCPDYCNEEVATHALALVLALNRRLQQSDKAARTDWQNWSAVGSVPPLSDQTIGIVGYGRTGRLLASYLEPVAGSVLTFDPYTEHGGEGHVQSLDDLLAQSDIVSLHVPLNGETRGLISARELGLMKAGSSIVNVSRGGIIDEQALVSALESGHIGSAALDVLSVEPPTSDNVALTAPNLLLTPHTAWYSTRSETRVRTDIVQAMLDYLEDGTPNTAVVAADARRPTHTPESLQNETLELAASLKGK